MFKNHPKGLVVLFFANMGERFGYYTMIPIFALFFQARFGLSPESVGNLWSAFLFAIYFLPLFGGILADKIGYGKTITFGIVLMIVGYAFMGIPTHSMIFIYFSLFVIALGTGFFKGNLAVILGNLYEEQGYKKLHDAAFNIFYMGINIGAFFAPYAATFLRDWLLGKDGFTYVASVPGMIHQFYKGKLENVAELEEIARQQMGNAYTNITDFGEKYIDSLSQGYNAAFALAACSIVISLLIFKFYKKYYKHADYLHSKKVNNENAVELTPKQTKERVVALILVFTVVIFFWMAFHQNGLTLTWFARDYTVDSVSPFTKIFFDLPAFLSVIGILIGLVFAIKKSSIQKTKLIGIGVTIASAIVLYWRYGTFQGENPISPELFQSFNPIFVVFLTPVIVAFFAWLNKRGKEPSSPKKIGIGMLLLAAGWIIMILASLGLISPKALAGLGGTSPFLVAPYWLIGMYFTLTVSELFISPMGLAFVAKVSPPKFRGMMQGGWLAATAIGNMLSGQVAKPYAALELWQTYTLLVITSLMSAAFMFLIMKKLERATS
ncbi:MAG: peptide MFS transporter [Acidobacteriota bacterium]